jgi:hypothetical protein
MPQQLDKLAAGLKEFLKKYGNGEDLVARLYLKGIGDGISVYSDLRALRRRPGKLGQLGHSTGSRSPS